MELNSEDRRWREVNEMRRGEERRKEQSSVFVFRFFFPPSPSRNEILHIYSIPCMCVCVKRNTWKYTQRQWFRNKTQSEKRERDEPLIHHENVIVLLFVSCLISFLLTTAFSSFKGTCALVFFFWFFLRDTHKKNPTLTSQGLLEMK